MRKQVQSANVGIMPQLPALNEPAKIAGTRLPYHPAINEQFGIDKSGWRALVEAVFPLASSAESVILALSYCKARRLDPFKRPVNIVPMWNGDLKKSVDTVWPGIGELRITAMRGGQYAGCDACTFGPDKTESFEKEEQNARHTIASKITFPEWAQITVYRMVCGQRVPVQGPRVYWLESCARAYGMPTTMWQKRPHGQIEKCAEAAALRRAFPEEIGNDYTSDEMHGQALMGGEGRTSGGRVSSLPPLSSPAAALDAFAEETEDTPSDGEEDFPTEADGHPAPVPMRGGAKPSKAPTNIPVGQTEADKPNWNEWGNALATAVKSAQTSEEVSAWMQANRAPYHNAEMQAPKVFEYLSGAVRERMRELRIAAQQGDRG